jgi:ZIP family zinc transporter
MSTIGDILLVTAIPVLAMVVGSMVTLWRSPGIRVRSAMQHLASGIVFAAVATELVPDMIRDGRVGSMLIGFLVGVCLVLGIRLLDERGGGEGDAGGTTRGSRGLLVTTGVDLLVDGFLVGIGFGLATSSGWMLTIAISFEVLFIGLSLAMTLSTRGLTQARACAWLCAIGLLVPVGAVAGSLLFGVLDADWQVGILSFGAAALLYLVTEELLVEAHEQGETTIGSAMFFVGFAFSLLLAMVLGH